MLVFLKKLVAVLVLVLVLILLLALVMVDDPQDLDEAEDGSQPPQGRLLVGVDLSHGRSWLVPGWLVAAGPQVQIHPAAVELELVDLALAVVLAVMLSVAPGLVLAGWRRQGA